MASAQLSEGPRRGVQPLGLGGVPLGTPEHRQWAVRRAGHTQRIDCKQPRRAAAAASVPAGRALTLGCLQCTCAAKTGLEPLQVCCGCRLREQPAIWSPWRRQRQAAQAPHPRLLDWAMQSCRTAAHNNTAQRIPIFEAHALRQGLPLSACMQHGSSRRASPTLPGVDTRGCMMGSQHRQGRMESNGNSRSSRRHGRAASARRQRQGAGSRGGAGGPEKREAGALNAGIIWGDCCACQSGIRQ